jgi:hypothetical protein
VPTETPQHIAAKDGSFRCVRLRDGRFHLIRPGPLPHLFYGGNHILVSETFAPVFRNTCAHCVDLRCTELVQVATGETLGRYYEVQPHKEILPGNISQVQVSGYHAWHFRHGELFVSPAVVGHIIQQGIAGLSFSPGFSKFAGTAF